MRRKITKAMLIKALEPFAHYGVVYGEQHKPDGSVWDRIPDAQLAVRGTCDQHSITVGALRKAASLYFANGGNPITPEQVK